MKTRHLLLALAGLGTAATASAQRGVAPVRGVVFDSLRGRPLRDAFVTVAGSRGTRTTDAQGRFRFDSIPQGKQTFVAQHPLLDSIGLSGLSAAATISDATNEVRLAIPSFATLWRVACSGPVPKDSGIVYGTVREAANGGPAVDAKVEVSWSNLVLVRRRGVHQRRWNVETVTNAQGGFAVCGVPTDVGITVHASQDSAETSEIDLPVLTARVRRRDLFIGRTNASDSANHGNIRGLVTKADGTPWPDARVSAPGVDEVRTDDEGRFMLRGVAPGTRQVNVLAIGASPAIVTADVPPRATADVTIYVEKVPMLGAVKTSATRGARIAAMEFEERRKSGMGYVRDSTDISRYDQFFNVFRDIPSVTTQYRGGVLELAVPDGKGGSCPPDVMIDGAAAAFGHLIDLYPKEVAAVEVYPRLTQIPLRFQKPGARPQCGLILVWTKYGFRNR